MRTSAFFGAKTSDFSKFYVVSARTRGEGIEPVRIFFGQERRGLSQCGHFSDKEEGPIFCDYVRTSYIFVPYPE